jgi:N utilization substance protein B
MALSQQKFREIVFQVLYSGDFADAGDEDMIPFMMGQLAVTRKTVSLAVVRKSAIEKERASIDEQIAKASVAYAFERIPRIERNILRLGVYELFYDDQIPPKVAIAEAIRLSRKFATPEGATFVNAILDTLYKENLNGVPAGQTP